MVEIAYTMCGWWCYHPVSNWFDQCVTSHKSLLFLCERTRAPFSTCTVQQHYFAFYDYNHSINKYVYIVYTIYTCVWFVGRMKKGKTKHKNMLLYSLLYIFIRTYPKWWRIACYCVLNAEIWLWSLCVGRIKTNDEQTDVHDMLDRDRKRDRAWAWRKRIEYKVLHV